MIILVLILAAVLRLINLNQGLWLDEAINVVYARSTDFWWFVSKYPVGDFHPPGWFALLWVWEYIFGSSEVAVRLPSVILGIATVWLTYLLGKELFNKKIGLFAALLLAIAPLHVYYSQEARMYALAAFSVTLSFYFLNRLILKKRWADIGFMVSIVLILYSDYLAYLVIPAQFVYLILQKKITRQTLTFFLAPNLAILPWLFIFLIQLKTGVNTALNLPGWSNVVGGTFNELLLIPLKTFFGRASFQDRNLYTIVSVLAASIYGVIFASSLRKANQTTKLLIIWIGIPLLSAFLISFFVPVLSYFRMIFILPAVYLLLAKGIDNLPKKLALPSFLIICLISVLSLGAYYLNPAFQREDWRGAINFISKNINKESVVVFENNEIPAPARYYASDLSNFKAGLSPDLEESLLNKRQVFLFEYLADVYDPDRVVEKKLKELDFFNTETFDFSGVGFIKLYVKK